MARPGFWIDTRINTAVVVGTLNIKTLMTDVTASQSRRGWTCVRTIIGLDFARTVHDSGEGSNLVGVGIGVASQEAFTASAISNPSTNTDFPTRGWLWRAMARIWGFAADDPQFMTWRIEKDIRAKRKIDNGEMYISASNETLEGTSGAMTLTGLVRQYWLDE